MKAYLSVKTFLNICDCEGLFEHRNFSYLLVRSQNSFQWRIVAEFLTIIIAASRRTASRVHYRLSYSGPLWHFLKLVVGYFFPPGTPLSSRHSLVNGFSQSNTSGKNAISTVPNLIAELPLVEWGTRHGVFDMSAWCGARDSHTIVPWTPACWRQLAK